MFIAVKPDGVTEVLRNIASVDDTGDIERVVVTLVAGCRFAVRDCAAGRIIDHPGHTQYPDAGQRGDVGGVAGLLRAMNSLRRCCPCLGAVGITGSFRRS